MPDTIDRNELKRRLDDERNPALVAHEAEARREKGQPAASLVCLDP